MNDLITIEELKDKLTILEREEAEINNAKEYCDLQEDKFVNEIKDLLTFKQFTNVDMRKFIDAIKVDNEQNVRIYLKNNLFGVDD